MEEFFANLIVAVAAKFAGLINQQWERRLKKRLLRNRLRKDGWKWRRFESLRRAIREDEATTKELLFEIGARASTGQNDVWTLGK